MDRRSFLTLRSTNENHSPFSRAMTSQPIISQAGLEGFTTPLNRKTADQHVAVNTFPGLVHTARHTMGAIS